MNQNIKNFIDECGKEFEDKFNFSSCCKNCEYRNYLPTESCDTCHCHNLSIEDIKEIKQFISSRKISLIKMIVEMVESEKQSIDKAVPHSQHKFAILGHNQSLDTISSKLKEVIKE